MNSNRLRIFYILKLLIKYTDNNHRLSANDLINKLKSEYDFKNIDRKTIYSDIKALNEIGINIDVTNQGFYFKSLFSIAELKIIEDLINNFKDINEEKRNNLINEIRNFTSVHQRNILSKIEIRNNHTYKDVLDFINRILLVIANEETIIINFKDKMYEVIPFLLDYNNSHYYLYYSYGIDSKIYHIRIDRIKGIVPTSKKHYSKMRIDECRKIIKESVESFNSNDIAEIKIAIVKNKDFIIEHLQDNFDDVIINERAEITTANIKISVSSVLFSKLVIYGDAIKIISPKDVKDKYITFLKQIINMV